MNRGEQPGPLSGGNESTVEREVGSQSSLIGFTEDSRDSSPRSSNDVERSVELHIEELVLHGFAPGDRYLIGEAIELELRRLFAERGPPSAIIEDGEIGELDAGAFETEPDSNVHAIGAKVARAIYGGLRQ